MPAIVPTPLHSCRIAEPPRPASASPAQSKRKQPKTFFRHRFPHISRLSLPAWLLLFEERPTPFRFILSRGLKSTNRRFVLPRPDHFPNGVVSTIVSFGHFSSCPYCRAHVSARANANPFILGGGPQGNDAFLCLDIFAVPACESRD